MAGLWYVRLFRGGAGALALAAVCAQFMRGIGSPDFSVVSFFSFFTVLSNIAAGGVLLCMAVATVLSSRWVWLRGAVTVCMVTTGVVYFLLLQDIDLGSLPPWSNVVLHRIMPLVLAADWLVVRPVSRIRAAHVAGWLASPLVFVGYTELRGAVIGWYPYPFLNPDEAGGAAGVAGYVAGIAAGIVVLSVVIAWSGNWGLSTAVGQRRGEDEPVPAS